MTNVTPAALHAEEQQSPRHRQPELARFLGRCRVVEIAREDHPAARDDFAIDPVLADELPDGAFADKTGWLRTLPGMLEGEGGMDGFFICRMMRTR